MISVALQGLKTTVEVSSGSRDRELQNAVARIYRSFDKTSRVAIA